MELSPEPGEHTLTVVDEAARSITLRFKVE